MERKKRKVQAEPRRARHFMPLVQTSTHGKQELMDKKAPTAVLRNILYFSTGSPPQKGTTAARSSN